MSRRTVLFLVLALLATRLALLACAADVSGYGEEFAKGAAAKAMLDRLPVEHHRLCYAWHEGGGFAISHLKALLFLVVGPSVLASKLAALITTTLVLLAGLRLAARHFGARAALLFGVSFALAPESLLRFSLLSLGTHFEATLFVLLALDAALRLVEDDEPRARDAWQLGLAAGFGLYFSPQILPALLATAVFLAPRALRSTSSLMPALARAAAGFAIGALPLWIMLALVGKLALWPERAGDEAARPGWTASLASLLGPITSSGSVATWTHALGFALAAGFACARARARAAWMLATYSGVFAAAYVASGMALAYDEAQPGAWFLLLRSAPLWTVGTLLACAGLARLWDAGHAARALVLFVLAAALYVGARGFTRLAREGRAASFENLRVLATTKGYLYDEYLPRVAAQLPGTIEERAKALLAFDDERELVAPAVAAALYDKSNLDVRSVLAHLPDAFGADAAPALLGLGHVLHGGWVRNVPIAFERLDTLDEAVRPPLAEAVGRIGLGPRFLPRRLDEQLAIPVPAQHRVRWLRGIGWRAHRAWRLRPDLAEAWILSRPPETREALRAGWERARALDSLGSH